MLTSLTVSNIVLIDQLTVPFSDGLTVLTGETGAGKSILLDALGLALGARADFGLIRTGHSEAHVSASFDLDN
ncbi:MAG: AAA family ATPase, partial [Candidatus Puniceispirillum sp.]